MNACEKYVDMISEYYDGELDEDSRAELEAHMESCENCRNYLIALKDISECTCEDVQEVPDMLSVKVMERIRKHNKKRGFKIAARYLGICACIAIIIFVAPSLPDLGCGSKDALLAEEPKCDERAAPTDSGAAAKDTVNDTEDKKADMSPTPAEEPCCEDKYALEFERSAEEKREISSESAFFDSNFEEYSMKIEISAEDEKLVQNYPCDILDDVKVYYVSTDEAIEMFGTENAVINDMELETALIIVK